MLLLVVLDPRSFLPASFLGVSFGELNVAHMAKARLELGLSLVRACLVALYTTFDMRACICIYGGEERKK